MLTRRAFALTTPVLLGACTADGEDYDAAIARIWKPGASTGLNGVALQRELVRYATLAPSSHNTQCWKFGLEQGAIAILPDMARRCPIVDPDDHHLFVSLGCAAENLAQAALAHGLAAETEFDSGSGRLRIALAPTAAASSPLFEAIPHRQSTRGEYDGQPLSATELGLLQRAASGNGVRVLLLTDKAALEKVLEFVVQGNTAQLNDPAFRDELKAWIRFSSSDAVRLGDGLYAASSGNPTLPTWLGNLIFGFVVTAASENARAIEQVRSSAGLVILVGKTADRAHWVESGRAYQRFALEATVRGFRHAFVNQAVEVAAVREKLAAELGIPGRRPDMILRFGNGPEMPRSLRRPVSAVIV